MKRARFAVLFAASAALLQAGCGDSDSESTAASGSQEAAAVSGEDVGTGALLAQIRGHHRAALERYEAPDRKAALTHVRHPAREILDSLQPELKKHAPTTRAALARSLDRVVAAVEAGKSPAHVEARITSAAQATLRTEREAMGETAESDAYRGSVIVSLASTAAHEYEEALDDGHVTKAIEYQDAYGFVREAFAMYKLIAPAVKEKSEEEASEITEAFEDLEKLLPSGSAPVRPPPLKEVERRTTVIGAELEKTVGAKPAAQSDPTEVRENIEHLLDEVVRVYRPDRPANSAELAAEAYLENYEVIEGAVIKAAPEVNAKLEPLLGAELRKRIRERAPRSEIADMVRNAKQLLAEGVQAVEGEG